MDIQTVQSAARTLVLKTVQALDNERCLVQLKANSKNRNRGQYPTGVVMPFAVEAAGKALSLSRKGRRFWLSMSFDKTLGVMTEEDVRHYASQECSQCRDTHADNRPQMPIITPLG